MYHWQPYTDNNLIQVQIMHRFNFRVPFSVLMEYGTRKYYIAILIKIYQLDFIVPCNLKYLLQAQQLADFAARRSTEANERGSWQLHNYSLWWLGESRHTEHLPDSLTNIPAHSPSNSAAGTLKVYRFSHAYRSKLFSVKDIVLITLYSLLYKGISWLFLDLY